jgi:hypothetical protein
MEGRSMSVFVGKYLGRPGGRLKKKWKDNIKNAS